jgi:hypothetical protein
MGRTYRTLAGLISKLYGKWPLGISRNRWEDSLVAEQFLKIVTGLN